MEQMIGKFTIVNILNNSAIVVSDGHKEVVVIEQGIGFGKKKKEVISFGNKVEKTFVMTQSVGQFTNIVNGYQNNVVDAVILAINILQQKIYKRIDDEALLAFVDHLAACFGRIEKNKQIENFFYHETKILYPEAYDLALDVIKELEKGITFKIPEAEIAYIALHIENIQGSVPRRLMEKLNVIIYLIDDMLVHEYNIVTDKESYNYSRFLIHLKLLIKCVHDRKQKPKVDLSHMVEKEYPYEYEIATELKKIIEKELECKLNDDESAYITIHLLNIK